MVEDKPSRQGKNKDFIDNQWKPGQSGNPSGSYKSRPITARLIKLLEENDGANAEAIAKAFIEILKKPSGRGYAAQIRELLDRTEGTVKEELEVTEIQKIEYIPAEEKDATE